MNLYHKWNYTQLFWLVAVMCLEKHHVEWISRVFVLFVQSESITIWNGAKKGLLAIYVPNFNIYKQEQETDVEYK